MLSLKDEKVRQGLYTSFQMGLLPASFPAEDIAKMTTPCERGQAAAALPSFVLYGENANTPPRGAKRTGDSPLIIFLASTPRPDAALRRYKARGTKNENSVTFENKDMMVVLAIASEDGNRIIFSFYDRVPDDARLKAAIDAIASRKANPQAQFNVVERTIGFAE